jgi:hypothetical protein
MTGCANGEPLTVIDAVEAGSAALSEVRIHQMLPVRDRPYFHGERPDQLERDAREMGYL